MRLQSLRQFVIQHCRLSCLMMLGSCVFSSVMVAQDADNQKKSARAPVQAVAAEGDAVAVSEKNSEHSLAIKVTVGDSDLTLGQLNAAEGDVVLIRNGKVVYTQPIGPGRISQIPPLPTGVYSVAVRSLAGVAAAGLVVTGDNQKLAGQELDWFAQFALIPMRDYPAVEALVTRAMASRGRDGATKQVKYDLALNLPRQSNVLTREASGKVRARLVTLTEEVGIGEVSSDLAVHFLKEGKVEAYAETNAEGIIETASMEPGRYSMVVTGQAKMLLISVLVENAAPQVREIKPAISMIQSLVIGSSVPVLLQDNTQDMSNLGLINEEDFQQATQQLGIGEGGPGAPGLGLTPAGGGGAGASGAAGGGGMGADGGKALSVGLSGRALAAAAGAMIAAQSIDWVAGPATPTRRLNP